MKIAPNAPKRDFLAEGFANMKTKHYLCTTIMKKVWKLKRYA